MAERELRLAQQEILRGSKSISDAGMRLRGTSYERDYEMAWEMLRRLNVKLLQAIRGKGGVR